MTKTAQKVTFDNRQNQEFGRTVKRRVNAYFKERGLSKHANLAMVVKTVTLFAIYFGAYGLLISGILPLWGMWAMCLVMGIGMAGIGFSIAHDAMHGAYSKNKRVNRLLGFSFDILGANSYMWHMVHNIIHHTYTNIDGHDKDLDIAPFIRLSPHTEYHWSHRLQHILAFAAYSFATIFWVFIKDFRGFFVRDLGPYSNKKHPLKEWVVLFATKGLYYAYTIVVPLIVLDITWWQFLIGFFTLHLSAGIILGVVFQLAHVVEGPEFPEPNSESKIEENWLIHQMYTTSNFARDNKILGWYIGGLNYQIEHHLFPRVCSIHYPQIAPIVKQTAEEFGLPYNYHPSFTDAVLSHYRTLQRFGRKAEA